MNYGAWFEQHVWMSNETHETRTNNIFPEIEISSAERRAIRDREKERMCMFVSCGGFRFMLKTVSFYFMFKVQ